MANLGNSPRTMATSSQWSKRGQTQQSLWILSGKIFTLRHGEPQAGEEFRNAREQANRADVVFLGLRQQSSDQALAASRTLARRIDGDGANLGQVRAV